MNASINPKSAAAFTDKSSRNSLLLRTWFAIMFTALIFSNLPPAFAQSSSYPGIYLKVLDLRTGAETLACALFDSPTGFPIEFLCYATHIVVIEIHEVLAHGDFPEIPPETYEFVVILAETSDDKLSDNRQKIPTDSDDFTIDLKTMIREPSFPDAGFLYDGQVKELTIGLHY